MNHVAYCFDANYQQHFGAAVVSLLESQAHQAQTLHIHIVTDIAEPAFADKIAALAAATRATLQVHPVDLERLKGLADLPTNTEFIRHLNASAYFRLMLPDILPASLERVLYLDTDTLVVGDLTPLFEADLKSAAVAAVEDLGATALKGMFGYQHYINSGVLVLDLAAWRARNYTQRCLDYAATHPERVVYADQCCINNVLMGDMVFLSPKWNRQVRTASSRVPATPPVTQAEDARILHFVGGNKPWQAWYMEPPGALYWHYLERSPWRGAVPSAPVTVDDNRLWARKLATEGRYLEACQLYEDVVTYLLAKSERREAEAKRAAAAAAGR